ncbi:response regulator [Sphingobium cloacae]|uniref:histidine kinase n=1 Tax=Sphingobium cloacae TaxID=120107 RepID=A0A1E1EYI8_9SPHN|nr:response regulator [Sphingobium cloacae]BAV63327.1 multi-sensor hybrid histidine kinase [Sphingobium cloacae]
MTKSGFARFGSRSDTWAALGLIAGLVFFLVSGVIAYLNIQTLRDSDQAIRHTHSVLVSLEELLSTAQDAETGQRGYLLTGDPGYLEPYTNAVAILSSRIDNIAAMTRDNPTQQTNLVGLKRHVNAKLAELRESIDQRRAGQREAAVAVVESGRGKDEMDAIRAQLDIMAREEMRLREIRIDDMASASRTAITSGIVTGLLGAVLVISVFILVRRNSRARVRQSWLQAGHLGLAAAMRGDQSVEQLGEAILAFLARYLGFQGGALFKGEEGLFQRVATLGIPSDADIPQRFGTKEGLLGQVATEGRPQVLRDVPDHYLTIGSAFGRDRPRHLVIVPAKVDDVVNAVLELGFFEPVDAAALELLDEASLSIGIALRSARFRARLQDALEETQRQAEELQAQGEELRANNDELETQSRQLQESATRLEAQQSELEQTNAQLEEQARQLQVQRDDLARAQVSLRHQAADLEQASRYKSEFLANMSHELRTPLNSLLIMARLLAENRAGNLTADQVRHAETIETSGNDLLTLINDILDISKIEAGKLELQPRSVRIATMLDKLQAVFAPSAEAKGLSFRLMAGSDPAEIETDSQRVEQILKNFLSNAIKFTEKGEVALTAGRHADGRIAFTVRDTGVGIAAEQQKLIFEPFRQADGTISRKYGGTGLGLSISRELARLLGGELLVESDAGQGSAFSLLLPDRFDPTLSQVPTLTLPDSPKPLPASAHSRPRIAANTTQDDRETLSGDARLILIVEDDPVFAGILCDIAHEQGFQCLIAGTADEGALMARQYLPHAVILDMNLPDHTGLSVLDRIKRDVRTRHIPVHVVSVDDDSRAALSSGAIGYLFKPVKREALIEMLEGLEARMAKRMRRVLVVEDDAQQAESIKLLLASRDVETMEAHSAAQCFEMLGKETFDCMVLDLNLPDASGLNLLERLSVDENVGFPPVIVYTGRDLDPEEELRLRRYSKSIIVKGVKSPERLLDEVTLFLHQVVSELPETQQQLIARSLSRDEALEGRNILVVEDDIRNVYALTSIFEPHGVHVRIARNGREALAALDESARNLAAPVDLVLMDVMMPEMDGLAATREIRRQPWGVSLPIIALTAKAMAQDQQECLVAGANDYLAKPLDVDKLLSLVRVWMPR